MPTQPNEAGEYVLSTGILQTGNPAAGVVGGTAGSGGFALPQTVAPGVTVQVQGSVTAPLTSGNYTMYAEMNQLWEQVFCAAPVITTTDSYNNCPTFSFVVVPPPSNSASLSFVSVGPSTVAPGVTISFTVAATNTGTSTWVAASNPVPTQPNETGQYVLSTGILQTGNPSAGIVGGTAGYGGFALPQSVAPGQTVQVQGSMTAPQTPGNYTMYAAMNQLWEQVFCAAPFSSYTGSSYNTCPTFSFVGPPPASLSIITEPPLPAGTVGVPYSQALTATGGVTPYKGWSVAGGTVPPGLSLSTLGGVLTGLLNGVPTTPGTFVFTVQVTDNDSTAATKQFSLMIGGGPVSISPGGIVNAASYGGGSLSPGELVTIFGSGLGPSTLVGLELNSSGNVSTLLSGTQVLLDGLAAPMIYTLAGQVSAVVPYEVSGKSTTQVQVVYQGQGSNLVSMPVTAVMPGIFTMNSSGSGPGAIVNQDGTVNSASNPATAGSYVFVYATGEGQTNPAGADGKPNGAPAPVPVAQPVTATIGGINAYVQYAGGVPGLVAGVLQVNVLVPQGVASGGSIPVVLTVGGQSAQGGVTVAIK